MSKTAYREALFYAMVGGFIPLLVMGARQALGLYLEPISKELSLGRESFALCVALANLFWGLGAPFTGSLSDKYGAMPVLIFGAVSYTAGLVVLGMAQSEMPLLLGGILIGLGL